VRFRETATFLFTDIEGSTRRWLDEPDAMRALLMEHDAILRDVIDKHRGHLFKHTGSMSAKNQLVDEQDRSARGEAIAEGKRKGKEVRAKSLGWTMSDREVCIGPFIGTLTLHQITEVTGLSTTHASRIKSGKQIPDPRHWAGLRTVIAQRVGYP